VTTNTASAAMATSPAKPFMRVRIITSSPGPSAAVAEHWARRARKVGEWTLAPEQGPARLVQAVFKSRALSSANKKRRPLRVTPMCDVYPPESATALRLSLTSRGRGNILGPGRSHTGRGLGRLSRNPRLRPIPLCSAPLCVRECLEAPAACVMARGFLQSAPPIPRFVNPNISELCSPEPCQ
jgi:hypothetical protein